MNYNTPKLQHIVSIQKGIQRIYLKDEDQENTSTLKYNQVY